MTIRKICWTTGIAAVLIGGLGLKISMAQDDNLDVSKLAPDSTKILIDNVFVRVTEETVQPGNGLPKHRHLKGVTVALSDYDAEQTIYPGERHVRAHRRKGEVMWAEPVVHATRNVGTTIQNVIRIELK